MTEHQKCAQYVKEQENPNTSPSDVWPGQLCSTWLLCSQHKRKAPDFTATPEWTHSDELPSVSPGTRARRQRQRHHKPPLRSISKIIFYIYHEKKCFFSADWEHRSAFFLSQCQTASMYNSKRSILKVIQTACARRQGDALRCSEVILKKIKLMLNSRRLQAR